MAMEIPPFDEAEDEDAELPESLRLELAAAKANRTRGLLPCIWLDMASRKCRHYDHRPKTCREFVPGGEICEEDQYKRDLFDGMSAEQFAEWERISRDERAAKLSVAWEEFDETHDRKTGCQ